MAKGKANGHMDRAEAEFVVITAPGDAFKGPYPVILDVGAYIWVPNTKEALTVPGVLQVVERDTDGSKSFDANGNCIVSVPDEWCSFITEEQANKMAEALSKEERASA